MNNKENVKKKGSPGRPAGKTRESLLKATERLMLNEGYAAVSTRRVAKEVGVTPALVHYYFKTTDKLLLEILKRKNDLHEKGVEEALNSERPLRSLWNYYKDTARTGVSNELVSMVNHHKVIRKELAKDIEKSRNIQAQRIEEILSSSNIDKNLYNPLSIVMLISGLGRTIVSEKALGVSCGHTETINLIENLIDSVEGSVDKSKN